MPQTQFSVASRARPEGGGASVFTGGGESAGPTEMSHSVRDLPTTVSPPVAADHQQFSAVSTACGIGLHVHSDLSEVEDDWRAFEREADRTAFQAFDWVATWQRHIGARSHTIPAIVLGRKSDGRLLFIMQLAIETRGVVRRLCWLGSRLCDYNAPLLSQHFSESVNAAQFVELWDEIIDLLRASPYFRFDVVDLQKMPEAVGTQRNPFLDLPVRAHPSGAYVATLGREWEQYYAAKRSSSTRKRERRQLKQLAEHGEVRFVEAQDLSDIERTLNTLFEQKTNLFARMGVKDIFALPGYREFYLDVATRSRGQELTHVSRLDVGSTMAAANVGLKAQGCYYLILSSYQDGELSRFGPGRAHLNELLRHAINCGIRRFDFTIGDEPYKRDWCDTELRLYDHLAAASLRGWLEVAVMTAFRRAKRFIKQTPVLWHVFTKARVLAQRFAAGLRFRPQGD